LLFSVVIEVITRVICKKKKPITKMPAPLGKEGRGEERRGEEGWMDRCCFSSSFFIFECV